MFTTPCICATACLVNSPVTVIKGPDKRDVRGKDVFVLHLEGTLPFLGGRVLAAGTEGTVHIASTVRKQRAVIGEAQSPSSCACEAHVQPTVLLPRRVDPHPHPQ